MPTKALREARLDELLIRRDGQYAVIHYREHPFEGGMNLGLGADLEFMSDEDIVEAFNEVVRSMNESIKNYRSIEIKEGYPQIKYERRHKSWSPVGDVLRLELHCMPEGGLIFQVDDKELSVTEFIRMLESYSGWGLRLHFMHPTELTNPPTPELLKAKPRKRLKG